MSQFQYLFGNPRTKQKASNKGSGRSNMTKKRKKVKRKRNPMQYQWGKGATLQKGKVIFPSGSELIAVKKKVDSLDKAIEAQKKKIKSYKGAHQSQKHLGLLTDMEYLKTGHKKAHTAFKNLKGLVSEAKKEATAAKGRGAKPTARLIGASIDPKTQKQVTVNLSDLKKRLAATDKAIKRNKKKAVAAAKSAKKSGGTMDKKKKKIIKKKKVVKKKVVKKKATKKKATKKKTTKKNVVRKKIVKRKKKIIRRVTISRPKRVSKKVRKKARKKISIMKSVGKALRKKRGVAKGKKRTYYARNPKNIFNKFGGNMKLKGLIKYDMPELGGLALGGALHGSASNVLGKIPFIGQYINAAFAKIPFLAPLSPIALVILVGLGNKFARKGKSLPNALELAMKGLVGASVVGLGATVGQYASSSVPALSFMQGEHNQLGGKFAHDYPGLNGEYEQLGYDESDYTVGGVVPMSFDSAIPETESGEDFGIEYENFDGNYEQMG